MSLAATYYLASRLIGGNEMVALLRRPAAIQVTALTLINATVIIGYTVISGAPILVPALISLLLIPIMVCADYGYAFLLGAKRHGLVNAFRSLALVIYAAVLVVLFALGVPSVLYVVLALVGSNLIACLVIMLTGLREMRTFRVDRSIVSEVGSVEARRKVLAFGRKGYVGYLSPVDTFRIDQLAVGFLLAPRVLGVYVVGAAFTNFGRSVALNIGLSSTPEIASHASPNERAHSVRRTLVLSAGVLAIITLILEVVVIFAIPVLFGNAYRSAIPVAEILLIGGGALAMKRIAVDAMRGAGETRAGTRAEIVNVVVFLVACVPAAVLLGGPGVALAVTFAAFCGSVVLVRRLQDFGVVPHVRRSGGSFMRGGLRRASVAQADTPTATGPGVLPSHVRHPD
jgi:O-antigen/teichoic acid export membrane protein